MAKVQNHLIHLLKHWEKQKDDLQWVLATIIGTEGSSYRKSGAMMLINSLGQYHGMLSGGCLESDIMRQARRCWDNHKNRIIQYDMREEEDLAWQLGIGCGGLVRILLQPVSKQNEYLFLPVLLARTSEFKTSVYQQVVNQNYPVNKVLTEQAIGVDRSVPIPQNQSDSDTRSEIFTHRIKPAHHVVICGGGADAIPLVELLCVLGWSITLLDPRAGYARKSQFPSATWIINQELSADEHNSWLDSVDATVIMSHNVKLDAQALALVQKSTSKFVGVLGPAHRTDRVLKEAGLTRDQLSKPLSNPIGLRLGGELPESIALSIVSEIHAFLEGTDAQSISGVLV